MHADKAYVQDAELIVDSHHQPIPVTTNVEYDAFAEQMGQKRPLCFDGEEDDSTADYRRSSGECEGIARRRRKDRHADVADAFIAERRSDEGRNSERRRSPARD